MKKPILTIILISLTLLLLCSCDNDNDDTNNPDYQRGYNAGVEEGKNQICNDCDDNAENTNQQNLCSTICD